MPAEFDSDIEKYPELDPEAEGEDVANSDARPVSSQPNDWNISTLRDKFERGQVDLQPLYQRQYVWELKPELPSRLVESLLLETPVPPIYFGKMPVLLDGNLAVQAYRGDHQLRARASPRLLLSRSLHRPSREVRRRFHRAVHPHL